ncbi:MAG: leucine-rich repeat domain-containing protein, partial [Clostridia bacterium]|nr:leucine-rich repeat domain-containing protein [Clostridia bacterium]
CNSRRCYSCMHRRRDHYKIIPISVTLFTHSGLTRITVPKGVKDLSGNAFQYCMSLATVTLQDGLNTIGENAFYCCSSLKTLNMPASVKRSATVLSMNVKALPRSRTMAPCRIGKASTLINLPLPTLAMQ